jgi:hypothetical protein
MNRKLVITGTALAVLMLLSWTVPALSAAGNAEKFGRLMEEAGEYERAGAYYDALEKYMEASSLKRRDYGVRLKIAEMYRELGDRRSFLAACEEAVIMRPGAGDAYYLEARFYADSGEFASAIAVLNSMRANCPPDSRAEALAEELSFTYSEKYVSFSELAGFRRAGSSYYSVCEVNGRAGLCDSGGKKKIMPEYDSLGFPDPESGLMPCSNSGEWFFIDGSGNRRFVTGESYSGLGSFGSGYAPAEKNGIWGYIDRSGGEHRFEFKYAGPFCDGVAAVRNGEGWGLIGGDLSMITDFGFECILTDDYGYCSFFGVTVGRRDGLWYYMDTAGNRLSETGYEEARPPASYDGPVAVRPEGYGGWSFVTTGGELLFTTGYEDAGSFSCGLAPVFDGENWGYIDMKNELRIPSEYSDVTVFSGDGTAGVRKYRLWYLIKLCAYER